MVAAFRGWSDAALDLYRGLEADNSRTYWAAHKAVYDAEVKAPFEALSDLVADEFAPLTVSRPHRDLRFSKDKTPYKTRCYAVGDGEGGARFYAEVTADGLSAATGYWMMASDQLARYREAVDDDVAGQALVEVVAGLRRRKLEIVGQALATAPRGYRRDHPRVELLRYKSLGALRRFPPAAWLHTAAAAKRITGAWRDAAPLNAWLSQHVGPPKATPNRFS